MRFQARLWVLHGRVRCQNSLTPGSWPPSERSEEDPGYTAQVYSLAIIHVNGISAILASTGRFALSTDFVSELYLALSKDRFEAYRPLSGSDLDMLTNYFWNIDLVEALVPCLHAVELALRNSIHAALTARYGTNMWFYEPGVLESNELIGPGKALQSAARKPPLRGGRIVAALSFGFWIDLLSGRYEQRLWQPDRFALQRFVFFTCRSVLSAANLSTIQ